MDSILSSNHMASVVRLQGVRKHTNADKLQCVLIEGNNVIIGMDSSEGQIGLYFPEGLQISEEFAAVNDLVRRKDENGLAAGGMFDTNRKVRCQILRGEKSDGFFINIESLESFGDFTTLKVGDMLASFNNKELCKKFIGKHPKINNPAVRSTKIYFKTFPEHTETSQLMRHLDKIEDEDIITISVKLHGTSGRTGYIQYDRKPTFVERLLIWLNFDINLKVWGHAMGSRRVVLSTDVGNISKNAFHSNDMRNDVVKSLKGNLYKGEVIYYEIVGYEPNGNPIMPLVNTKKISKEFAKEYSNSGEKDRMVYKYGCIEKTAKAYVYRIIHVNEDGKYRDMPWNDMVKRATQLGLETPVVLFHGKLIELKDKYHLDENKNLNLEDIFFDFSDGPDPMDNSHWREGIVVRIEKNFDDLKAYKLKNFNFKTMESASEEASIEDLS